MARTHYTTGDLDHRLGLLKRTQTDTSAYNEPVYSYPLQSTVWAKRIDASSGEQMKAREVKAEVTAHFVVRYSPQTSILDPTWRVQVEGGLTYDVTGVRELARNKWLEVHAVARAEQ